MYMSFLYACVHVVVFYFLAQSFAVVRVALLVLDIISYRRLDCNLPPHIPLLRTTNTAA